MNVSRLTPAARRRARYYCGLVSLVLLCLAAACTTSSLRIPVTPLPTLTPGPPTIAATRPPLSSATRLPSRTPNATRTPLRTPSPMRTATAVASPTAPVPTATPVPDTETPTPGTETPTPTPFGESPALPEETTTPLVESPTPASAGLTYVFPVQPVAVAEYEAFHHDYPATDIFCPVGSQFVAPTSGVVNFVRLEDRWDPATDDPAERGGIAVAIVGDDGVRYYGSHLATVAEGITPGVRVQAGQVLGLTGQSGNARVTPPQLHFGISHPTTPDDWQVRRGEIAPYPYLRAWAAGTSTPPQLDQ